MAVPASAGSPCCSTSGPSNPFAFNLGDVAVDKGEDNDDKTAKVSKKDDNKNSVSRKDDNKNRAK